MKRRTRTRPVYSILEGIEASGKSAVIGEVARLLGDSVEVFKSPDGDRPIGQLIHRVFRGEADVRDRAILHLMAAEAMDTEPDILEAMRRRGKHAITHRHNLVSAMVYQSSVHDMRMVRWVNPLSMFIRPDLLVLLDIDPRKAVERLRNRQTQATDGKFKTFDLDEMSRRRRDYIKVTGKLYAEHWPRKLVVTDASKPLRSIALQVVEEIQKMSEEV